MPQQDQHTHSMAETVEQRFALPARRRPMSAPVTVAFLAREHTFWYSFASIVEECRRRPRLRPVVILKDGEVDGPLTQEHPVEALRAQGVRVVGEYAWKVLEERPDVLFLQKPYILVQDDYVPDVLVAHGIRPALIPYCTESLGGDNFLHHYFRTTPCFWRVFASGGLSAGLYTRLKRLPPQSVPVTGNPEYDMAGAPELLRKYQEIRSMARGRRVVLWTPHYAMTPPFQWSTWDTLGLDMARIFARHKKDVFVVLRPHQLLRHLCITWASGQKVDKYHAAVFDVLRQAENFCLDVRGTCLEAVLACDALVSDVSSMLAKAMRFGKSVLATIRPGSDGMGPAQAVADAWMHQTDDIRGVQRFLLRLLRGEDSLLPVPDAVLDDFCGVADGKAAVRIADHLEAHFFPADSTPSTGCRPNTQTI